MTPWLLGFLVVATAVVFEVWSRSGASVAVIYLLWLILSLRSARPSALWTSTCLAVCLTLIGFFTVRSDLPPQAVWAARGTSVVAVWLTAVLCLAEQLKLREANRLLELQAGSDALTGLANRRMFDQTLEKEWKRCQRSQSPLTIAMLDVDHFKQYNDLQGHLDGDECLKAIAQAIQSNVRRPCDLAARYGGEEFALILPETDQQGAATVMKNLLAAIHQMAIPHPGPNAPRGTVTASIGCATVTPSRAEAASLFLKQADQALYQAKANGRDGVQYAPRREPAMARPCFPASRALQRS